MVDSYGLVHDTYYKVSPSRLFFLTQPGPDSQDIGIRPAPKIDSAEVAGEMAEVYWMALCRDVPFGTFEYHWRGAC